MLAVRKRRSTASHHVVVTGRVPVVGMTVAAHHGEAVGDLRALAAMLGENRARHGRRDRLKGTSHFQRRLGFRIPHVLLRGATFQKNEDAGFRAGLRGAGGLRFRLEQPRKRESGEQAAGPQTQDMAPSHPVAEPTSSARKGELKHAQLFYWM